MIRLRKFVVSLLLIAGAAWGDDGHGHNHGGDIDVDSAVTATAGNVGGDVSVRDTSRAFGIGAGNAYIRDCYRSWSVIGFQDSRANLWCMANDLDERGLHDTAARTRCEIKAYRKIFPDRQACIAATTAIPVVTGEVLESSIEHLEDEEEYHEEQQMLVADLEAKLANLEQAQAEERDRRRAAQREAARRDMEQREYAQQALEELAEWK